MKNILFIVLLLLGATHLTAQNTETLTSNKLVRGAYKTHDDFIRNKPSIIDSFYVKSKARTDKNWIGSNSLTPRYSKTNRRIKKIWGFCDGDTSYIFHQTEFFPIKEDKDKYSFIGFDLIDNSGAASAGLVGGAIGGGIYGAVALSKAKSKKIEYIIDKTTGYAIHPYKISPEVFSGPNIIIYRRSKKELEQPIEFLVNDTITYSFIPNSFVRLYFTNNSSSMKISYGTNFSKSIIIDRDVENDKYIRCSLLGDDEIPSFIEVETSEGEFESYRPWKVQKKREKTIGNKSS